MQDRLQLQRFELKYVIPEGLTPMIRSFVSAHLRLDEYAARHGNHSYPIHSLYLDSDGLALYWDTINGSKNRYKLRLRFYDNAPASPVFFEIKRRTNEAILKQRCAVQREAVEGILDGQLPEPRHLLSNDPRQWGAIQQFNRLMLGLDARPKAHVAYRREAWISPVDNAVRVTMDRDVRTEPESIARLSTEMDNPTRVFGKDVILEIKFTGCFPNWFGEMARTLGLQQRSAAKYADGVALLGEHRLRPGQARGFAADLPPARASQCLAAEGIA
jgi:hypothetical protein